MRLRSGDKHHLRKSADEKHKSGRRSFRSPDWFVLFDLQIFSGGVYPPSATSRTISLSISNIVFILVCLSDLNLLFLADYWTGWFLSKNAKCKKSVPLRFFKLKLLALLSTFLYFYFTYFRFPWKLLLLKHSVACLFVENSITVGLLCASMGAVRIAKFNGRYFGCHRG